MRYVLIPTTQFKKDLKRIKKRGYNLSELENIIDLLIRDETLDKSLRDHALTGNYAGFRECHVRPDWLFIYAKDGDRLILTASRTGTHSDLFNE